MQRIVGKRYIARLLQLNIEGSYLILRRKLAVAHARAWHHLSTDDSGRCFRSRTTPLNT